MIDKPSPRAVADVMRAIGTPRLAQRVVGLLREIAPVTHTVAFG